MRLFLRLLKFFLHFNKPSIKRVFYYSAIIAIFISTFNLAHSFQLTLAWDPNSEPDLAGYKVYYGTVSETYMQEVDIGKYESVTISGLKRSKTYFFAVTAYDLQGNESNFSDEISYRLCGCDLNTDGSCDSKDWLLFYPDWGRTDCNESGVEPCECDLNEDGSCDGLDWLSFYPDWGRTDC